MLPNHGCSHDPRYLQALMPRLIYFDKKQQSKCADIPTRTKVKGNNEKYLLDDIHSVFNTVLHQPGIINATIIGNMAFISLHGNDKVKQQAELTLMAIISRLQNLHESRYSEKQRKNFASEGIVDPVPAVLAYD